MNDFSERIIVGIGKVLGTVADLLPGGNDDWCERDYERAVRRAEKVLPEDDGEALEPQPRTTDVLGPDERDAEWVSKHGAHWRWKGDRWEALFPDSWVWGDTPVGYIPQASGPFTAIEPQRERMDWWGWAVPAILEVLAEEVGPEWWLEPVADKIADRIACDPQRAIKALQASDSL
jgi:hypothetical protein